jgi:hypothetical protein
MSPKLLGGETMLLLCAKARVPVFMYLTSFPASTGSEADGHAVQSHLLNDAAP